MIGFTPKVVDLTSGLYSSDDLWVHDEGDLNKAEILVRFFEDPAQEGALPRPFGVFYQADRPIYEDQLGDQIQYALEQKGEGDLDALIQGAASWEVK